MNKPPTKPASQATLPVAEWTLSFVEDVIGQIEATFQEAASTAVEQAKAQGVPVAILMPEGHVAWWHPDGSVRPEPSSAAAGRHVA